MTKQLSEQEAIKFYNSKVYDQWSLKKIARFQLFQDRMCVPFGLFHKAMEDLLGRPVYTHEFANVERIRQEYLTLAQSPTIEEIIEMIPEEKRIIINLEELKR